MMWRSRGGEWAGECGDSVGRGGGGSGPASTAGGRGTPTAGAPSRGLSFRGNERGGGHAGVLHELPGPGAGYAPGRTPAGAGPATRRGPPPGRVAGLGGRAPPTDGGLADRPVRGRRGRPRLDRAGPRRPPAAEPRG